MIDSPWFSVKTGQGSGKMAVYHQNTSCKAGKNIGKTSRQFGTDDRPLCKQCARLNDVAR